MISQKAAKVLRRMVRLEGLDYRDAKYDWRVRVHSNGYQQYIQRMLQPGSGRARYQQLKSIHHGLSS